jgi:hypothetical protein
MHPLHYYPLPSTTTARPPNSQTKPSFGQFTEQQLSTALRDFAYPNSSEQRTLLVKADCPLHIHQVGGFNASHAIFNTGDVLTVDLESRLKNNRMQRLVPNCEISALEHPHKVKDDDLFNVKIKGPNNQKKSLSSRVLFNYTTPVDPAYGKDFEPYYANDYY